MSGGPKGAKQPLERPLYGMRRDYPPSGNGVEAPRLVVFEVINLKPLKGEVPWSRLHEVKPFA